MSTKYFLLSKHNNAAASNNDDNQLVYLNQRKVFILPQVNLEYYSKHGLFESGLIDWCSQFMKQDKLFLDIGAHTGTYSISFSYLFREIHAFEPQRMTYNALCGGIALSHCSNIYAHRFGLGSPEQVGTQTLKIVSNDGGGSSLHHSDTHRILRTETIEIRTLDSMRLDNIGFIKMDVEDNELFVLKGGAETIRRSGCPPIVFESNHENVELFDYLRSEFGYHVFTIAGSSNMYLASLQ